MNQIAESNVENNQSKVGNGSKAGFVEDVVNA